MSIDVTGLSNSLQSKIDTATSSTPYSELLVLAKTTETLGSLPSLQDIINASNDGVTDINDAASAQFNLITTAGSTQVGLVQTEGTTQVGLVQAEGANQITLIQSAGTSGESDINTAKLDAVAAVVSTGTTESQTITNTANTLISQITQEGNDQVALVTTEGDAQVARVQGVVGNLSAIANLPFLHSTTSPESHWKITDHGDGTYSLDIRYDGAAEINVATNSSDNTILTDIEVTLSGVTYYRGDLVSSNAGVSEFKIAKSGTSQVEVLADLETEILGLYGSLSNIDTLATNISTIEDLNTSGTDLTTIATNITDITAVSNSLSDVQYVAANLTNITNNIDFSTVTTNTANTLKVLADPDGDGTYSPVQFSVASAAEFVATGAVASGDVVSLRSDGTVEVINGSNAENWIGIAAEAIADGQTGAVSLKGDVNNNLSGLVTNNIYFVNSQGVLTTDKTSYGVVGRAISDTELVVLHSGSQEQGGAITNSDTSPTNPNEGDLWYDTSSGELYVYVVDVDSSQWVQPSLGATSIPMVSSINGQTGDVTIDAGVTSVNGQTGDVTVAAEKTVHGATLNGSPVSLDFNSDAFNVSLSVESTELQFANQNSDASLLTQKLVKLENNSNPLPNFMSSPLASSTLSHTNGTAGPASQPDTMQIKKLRVSPDGQKLYLSNAYTNEISQFNMTTPWDFSTLAFDFNTTTSGMFSEKFEFSSDGSYILFSRNVWDSNTSSYIWKLGRVPLSTSWDLGVLTSAMFSIDSEMQTTNFPGAATFGWAFSADGTKLLLPTGSGNQDWAFYELGMPYTANMISSSEFSKIEGPTGSNDYDANTFSSYYIRCAKISADGKRIFWGADQYKTGMWFLDTPYDLQSFNPDKSDVHILDYNAVDVDFSADGTKGIFHGSVYSPNYTQTLVSFNSQGSKYIDFPNLSKVSSDIVKSISFNKSSLYEITSLDGGSNYYINPKVQNV